MAAKKRPTGLAPTTELQPKVTIVPPPKIKMVPVPPRTKALKNVREGTHHDGAKHAGTLE
jgi:hypothetical protein